MATPHPSWKDAIEHHVRYSLAKDWSDVTPQDVFRAVCLAVRERAIDQMLQTERRYRQNDVKRVYYLSMEFLVGRTLENNLLNLGELEPCQKAVSALGYSWETVAAQEPDPGLGNGGLGRLAVCFLDSLASLHMPGFGYGINYQFGLFRQSIENGYQREKPDRWMNDSPYWQVARDDKTVEIPLYGRLETRLDVLGNPQFQWVDSQWIHGVPHDMPVIGHGGETVNFLRLYSAQTSHDFDMSIFNQGDYLKAVQEKMKSETISKVLYPADSGDAGKELRLVQEYFFVACALRDILRRYRRHHETFENLPHKVAIQLNDTHPAIAIAEWMRLLVDDYRLSWEDAWALTPPVFAYTNHTLMAEALEKWPVPLFERVLPRHLQIIYEINRRHLEEVERQFPQDVARRRESSIIEEGPTRYVRMAHLAIVGSHSVNGVAALHSDLVQKELVPQFHALWPDRFSNKTNGVTPRRWVAQCNPGLRALLHEVAGPQWMADLSRVGVLETMATQTVLQQQVARIKRDNKSRLAAFVRDTAGIHLNIDSLFDVHAKRIHLYKRQLLNILRVIDQYLCLAVDRVEPVIPRTILFAGKAAPGYREAKLLIKLIHNVAQLINHDPRARHWLTVLFIPDYRVSIAELLIPAADLSEQISTAGYEASGTSNMKFAMNGALTIGTYDGATIEMAEQIGKDHFFLFGLKAQDVQAIKSERRYDPRALVEAQPRLQRVLETLRQPLLTQGENGLFDDLLRLLMDPHDPYLHLADFKSYLDAQEAAQRLYAASSAWTEKTILNISRMGHFSSDRTIQEYARDIWNVQPLAA